MNDVDALIVVINPSESQIDHHLFRSSGDIFQQNTGLFQLGRENVTVIRIARERAGADHQPVLVGHGNADLDPEFVGLPGFAFANALDFRGMQRIELVLVFALLRADALSTFEQQIEPADRARALAARCSLKTACA